MSSSATFIGSGFHVESATLIAQSTVRVRFSQDPTAVTANNANDALNSTNYTITGPGTNQIVTVGAVLADTQSIDLFFVGPFAAGIWTVGVHPNIIDVDGNVLDTPTEAQFEATQLFALSKINEGAENDDAESYLRKMLNPALKGDAWNALIHAIAIGEQHNWDNAKSAFDQLFIVSASGIYLDRLAADNGLARPDNLGLGEDTFRDYIIKTTNGKLVENSFLEILEIFYGSESLRAHVESINEPFFIQDGDDLVVLLDENTVIHTIFHNVDFAISGIVRAAEIAAALNRSFEQNQSTAYAIALADPETGINQVRIFSGTLGLRSAIRVIGGKAQNVLQFPTLIDNVTGLPTWVVTFDSATDTVRFLTTDSTVDLSIVQVGDYVNVYGAGFNAQNRGSFVITEVAYSYPGGSLTQHFEVTGLGVSETVTQLTETDVLFFRPTKANTHSSIEREVVVASMTGVTDIVLPVTSVAVKRQKYSAAYVQLNAQPTITTMERMNGIITVATDGPHSLSAGDQIIIDGSEGNIVTPAITTASTPLSSYSQGTIWSPSITSQPTGAFGSIAVRLLDGRVFHGYGYSLVSNVRTDNLNHVSVYRISNTNTMADGAIQVTSADIGSGLSSPVLSFPAASLATNQSWFYGSVVITGGEDATLTAQQTTSIYTPTSFNSVGLFASLGKPLVTARKKHSQITFNSPSQAFDGGFFITGGLDSSDVALASTERYSPVEGLAGGFTAMASMNEARYGHEAVVLPNGQILVIGGSPSATCELYDPTANTWAYTGPMTFVRQQHKAVLLPDGRVLVAGGIGYDPTQSNSAVPLKEIEVYDPRNGRWMVVARLGYTHNYPFIQGLSSRNQVIIGGGTDATGGITTEILDLSTFKVTQCGNKLANTLPGAVAAVVGTDTPCIALIGGYNTLTGNSGSLAQLYIPNSDTFLSKTMNRIYSVATVTSATEFTINTDDAEYANSTSPAVISTFKSASSLIPGPFTFDPLNGLGVTANTSTTTDLLAIGQQYASVDVADITQFPDSPGWLCFNFGYENQVGPVRYFGHFGDSSLTLDNAFRFTDTVPANSTITLLLGKGALDPTNAPQLGAFYLTDSSAARIAAQKAVESAAAAGIDLNISITYPGDIGLGGQYLPASGSNKLSDKVTVWGSNDEDADMTTARNED